MKSKALMVVFTVLVMSALAIGTAFAEWAPITTGYAVTTNWHGVDVWPGAEVTAWAGTTDDSVTAVKFIWLDPDKNEVGSETVSDFDVYETPSVPPDAPPEIANWAENHPELIIYYAISTPFTVPDLPLGDWTVKAYFMPTAPDPPPQEIVKRATSFNAVPETPWGPIAISAVFLAALGFFVFRKRLPSLPRIWN